MDKCPYCQRPSESDGAINHEGYCEGLKPAGLIVLQRYMLEQRIAALEADLARTQEVSRAITATAAALAAQYELLKAEVRQWRILINQDENKPFAVGR